MGDAAAPLAVGSRQLAGRDLERARIDAFARRLPDGARALVIRGETGIGKTALWRYGIERCTAEGHAVLVTRPTEEELPLATAGLVDLLEDADIAVLRDDVDPLERGRMVLAAFRRLTESGPVLVAIDDLQWVDSASAKALRYALRRLDGEPVGVLATFRTAGSTGDPLGLSATLPADRLESVELGPLDLDALRGVVSGVVESISRPALARIHEVSGGNPLFAIELARMPRSESRVELPDSLQEAISATLERAPPELAPMLDHVAVSGATPVAELAEALRGSDVPALLESARAQGLLMVDDDLRVRFAHPLMAFAVYARMGPIGRRTQHEDAAARAVDPDVRARHLALSTDEPDTGVADALQRAATRAADRGASDVAAELFGHSVRLTPPGDADAGRRRSLAQIEHLAAAGEVRRALILADHVVELLPPGPARVDALMLRADLEDDDRVTAEALLLGALDEAGDELRLRARVLHRLAQLRRLRIGDVPGAIESAREALDLAEQVGDPALQANASAYLGHLEALAGRPRPELMERAVRLEEEGRSIPLAVGPRLLLAKQRLWAGDLANARTLLEEVNAQSVRSGFEMKRAQHHYDLALLECSAGDLSAAERWVREGIEAAQDAENTYTERELLYPLALVQALQGRAEEARATAARLEEEAARYGVAPLAVRAECVLGTLALSEADAPRAAPILAAAAEAVHEMGFAHPGAFPILPDAIEAAAQTGDVARAETLLARLERESRAVGSDWAQAGALRGRGVVLLATGAPEDAETTLDAAREDFEGLGFRLDAARSQLARGSALLRAGRRSLAGDVLADARTRFAAAGAGLWEARAVAELDRAAPGRAAGELTSTERRVAGLVAEGLKNREIAGRLFMGVATVEAHLTRTYRKLGIRSRSELVRLVADGAVQVSTDEPPE